MNILKIKKPKVKVLDALAFAGSQSKLARILEINKASVNAWVSENREFVPDLQAYKLVSIDPGLDTDASLPMFNKTIEQRSTDRRRA